MHPIERLRWVARAPDGDISMVTAEAAEALACFADEPAGLVTACRRLIERRPECGPLWWMASRVLCAIDPEMEAELVAEDLARDRTAEALAEELPGRLIVVVGWPEQSIRALRYRAAAGMGAAGEFEVDKVAVITDGDWETARLLRWLEADGVDARAVPPAALGKVTRRASLVLLEAHALGPDGAVCAPGSAAVVEAARAAGNPVWLVAGVGRTLPRPLFDALLARIDERVAERLPLDAFDEVAGPGGLVATRLAAGRARCPVASELLRFGI